ncbi:MAG: hypothetical protein M0P47_09510 [Bacteroidales bacterium]|nr:hypothetical protein [Bacteroidales bacterium]
MKTLSFREILFLILIGILIATGAYLIYRVVSGNSKYKALFEENYALKHAKADTVIKFDSILVPGRTVIRPVPVKVEIHDTVLVPEKITWYDSVYQQGKVKFRWSAHVHGSIDYLEFSDFVWPEKTVTITKHIDTCFSKPPAYKAKFLHWGLYTELQAANFNEFPGIGLGAQVIFLDRISVGLGGVYDKGLKGNLRIGVLF